MKVKVSVQIEDDNGKTKDSVSGEVVYVDRPEGGFRIIKVYSNSSSLKGDNLKSRTKELLIDLGEVAVKNLYNAPVV